MREWFRGRTGPAEAAQIVAQDVLMFRKCFYLVVPETAVNQPAVDEDDCWPFTRRLVVESCALTSAIPVWGFSLANA